MKAWEALKTLEDGKKVRLKYWESGKYIYKTTDGRLLDNTGDIININLSTVINEEWEEVKEWINTGRFSTETREFVWIKCPYCSAEIRKIVHNGLVQMDKYCRCCGKQVD